MAVEFQDLPRKKWPAWLIPLLICIFLTLSGAGYFAFGRTHYATLFTDLRASDAAAIVTQLKKDGVSYRLAQGGATILVPAQKHDVAQLAIAGSGLSLNGNDGFELFNNSDMGLTDFAQKIKYQRALQGELSRTIMMMEGIKEARVHLAIPERSVFRGEQLASKAAVSVTWKSPEFETMSQVWGIQKLVASSIPGLSEGEVAVLNGRGQFLNVTDGQRIIKLQQMKDTPDLSETRTIVARILGDRPFEATYEWQAPTANTPSRNSETGSGLLLDDDSSTSGIANHVSIITREVLSADLQEKIRAGIFASNTFGEREQTNLRFQVNPNFAASSRPIEPEMKDTSASIRSQGSLTNDFVQASSMTSWALLGLAVSGVIAGLAWSVRHFFKPKLSSSSHAEFAHILKEEFQARFRGASADAS